MRVSPSGDAAKCLACQRRFTTYELLEILPIIVIKKDGSRQAFDKQKILNGLLRATEKRPISLGDLTKIVNSIELKLQNELRRKLNRPKSDSWSWTSSKTWTRSCICALCLLCLQGVQGHQLLHVRLTSLLKKNENVSGTDIN